MTAHTSQTGEGPKISQMTNELLAGMSTPLGNDQMIPDPITAELGSLFRLKNEGAVGAVPQATQAVVRATEAPASDSWTKF